jgi:hypothetical protein
VSRITLQTRISGPAMARAVSVIFFVIASPLWCHSSELLLIRAGTVNRSADECALDVATRFYGLDLKAVAARDNALLELAHQETTVAVAIDADALTEVSRTNLLHALQRKPGSVPLLIFGLNSGMSSDLLATWSENSVAGVETFNSPSGLQYIFGDTVGITQQLAGRAIAFPGTTTPYLVVDKRSNAQDVVYVRNEHQTIPILVDISIGPQKVFLAGKRTSASAADILAANPVDAFAEIAPAMIFVKYAAGERGWHSPAHYANFTIDDPWLREPYGQLNYAGLLGEMEKHNFHTTIAFIPWNYDRSQPAIAGLFRDHPDHFSISVHGDNHDHKEFEDLASKPLAVQTAAIQQSIARMEKFKSLTGIPYDDVFIFPHSIGTESVLEKLRLYNFSATVNSSNVPMDRSRPTDILFELRPVTTSFADFPSITRYSAAMLDPDSFIAVNAFLDNPLFFYAHHDYFAHGITAFDHLADEVNSIEPETRWRGLGDVMKHLYLVRARDDNSYEVQAFSNNLMLENPTDHSLVVNVRKQELAAVAMTAVTVDGQPYPFQLSGGILELKVTVPAHGSRTAVVRYKNDLDVASIPTAKDSTRVYVLRTISDFRDNTLSNYALGRAFTDYYYKHGSAYILLIIAAAGLGIVVMGGAALITRRGIRVSADTAALQKVKSSEETNDDCVHIECR